MAQKRRIVPQLISISQAPASEGAFAASMPASPALATASQMEQKPAMTLKEQSDYAAEHLGPGRRIYVELTQEKYEINWRKVCFLKRDRTFVTHVTASLRAG